MKVKWRLSGAITTAALIVTSLAVNAFANAPKANTSSAIVQNTGDTGTVVGINSVAIVASTATKEGDCFGAELATAIVNLDRQISQAAEVAVVTKTSANENLASNFTKGVRGDAILHNTTATVNASPAQTVANGVSVEGGSCFGAELAAAGLSLFGVG